MTLEQILIEVGELRSPTGDSLVPNYLGWINRAQKTITERRNWSFCRDIDTVVMPASTSTVNLPPTFKELATENSAVSYASPVGGGYQIPCKVSTRARLERWMFAPTPFSTQFPSGLPSFYMPNFFVFIERNGPGGCYTLNVMPQQLPQQDITFQIAAFWHMEPLASSQDSNALTDHGDLGDALINLVKSIAYKASDPTDERAKACREDFEERMRYAATADARNMLAGQNPRW